MCNQPGLCYMLTAVPPTLHMMPVPNRLSYFAGNIRVPHCGVSRDMSTNPKQFYLGWYLPPSVLTSLPGNKIIFKNTMCGRCALNLLVQQWVDRTQGIDWGRRGQRCEWSSVASTVSKVSGVQLGRRIQLTCRERAMLRHR